MIKSMTAYAAVEKTADQGVTVAVEMRTYNSRHLDLALRLPAGLSGLEEKIKSLVHSHLERGRIEMRLIYTDVSEKALSYEIDTVKLKSYLACLEQLKVAAQMTSQVTLDYLASLPGMIKPVDTSAAIEAHWPFMAQCIQEALALVDRMRSAGEPVYTEEGPDGLMRVILGPYDSLEEADRARARHGGFLRSCK